MKRLFTLFIFALMTPVVLQAQVPRKSVLEISESVYTLDNARTICLKEDMRSQFGDDLAILSFHPDDFQGPNVGEDPFFNNTSDQWWNTYGTPGFGQGFLDRVSYNSNNLVLGRSVWADTIAARVNQTSPADVTLPEVLYDPATREIFTRIQVDFEQEYLELTDFRFFLYIAADSQLGVQRFDTLDSNLCNLFIDPMDTTAFGSDTLDTLYHHDVVIAAPGSFDGVENIIPGEIPEGGRYTTNLTYTLPAMYDIEHLKVVGFVGSFDGGDLTANRVLNVAHERSFTEYDSEDPTDPNHPDNPDNPNSVFNPGYWPTGIEKHHGGNEIMVYPNPMTELSVVRFPVPSHQQVKVSVWSMDGRLVKEVYNQSLSDGEHKAAISRTGLKSGVYLIQIQGESFEQNARILVQ